MHKTALFNWDTQHLVTHDLLNVLDQPFVHELRLPRPHRDGTGLIECVMKYAAMLLALMFTLPSAQAVTPAPRMTGESLLKRLEGVDPATVPWKPDSNFSREELAYLHTVTNVEYVQGYIAALYDATEGKAWCYSTKYKVPKPDTFWDESQWGLNRFPPAQLKRNAADLLVEIWREKWPCLPSHRGE